MKIEPLPVTPDAYIHRNPAALLASLPARLLSWGVMHLLVGRAWLTCIPDWDVTPQDWTAGYSPVRYFALLRDRVRMEAYAAAIEHCVKDKVVLEIGTGAFAPLTQMALRAGARKVYAIEANPYSVASARRLVQEKGLQDQVEIIQGYSTEVTLPEKAEVLLHEIVGYFGSDEGMVRVVHDARQRLLVDKPIIVPQRCEVLAAPVFYQNPDSGSHLAKGFQRLFFGASKPSALYQIWNFPEQQVIAPGQVYEDWCFDQKVPLEKNGRVCFTLDRNSRFSGFLLWIRLHTDEQHVIETRRGTSWGTAYVQVDATMRELQAGDTLILETYQDASGSPRYRFHTFLQRGDEVIDLGVQRVRWLDTE
jgi:hypothetical protein